MNLIEDALGLDPNIPDTTASRIVYDMEDIGGDMFPRLTITRNPDATDLSLTVEVSDDMTLWRSDQTVIEADTPNLLRVRDSVPAVGSGKRFIHLRVTRP